MKQHIEMENIKEINYAHQLELVKLIGIYDWWRKEEHLLDVEMTERMLNRICRECTIGKMIEVIRLYFQMDIYTVNGSWHIQLFDLEEAANEDSDCIWEEGYGDTNELAYVLWCAVRWILESKED